MMEGSVAAQGRDMGTPRMPVFVCGYSTPYW